MLRSVRWLTNSNALFQNLEDPSCTKPQGVYAVCYALGALAVVREIRNFYIERADRTLIRIDALWGVFKDMLCTGEVFILWDRSNNTLSGWRVDGTPIRTMVNLNGNVVVPPPNSRWAGHFALHSRESITLYGSDMVALWTCSCPHMPHNVQFDMTGESLVAATTDGQICILTDGAVELFPADQALGAAIEVVAVASPRCIMVINHESWCGKFHICRRDGARWTNELILELDRAWSIFPSQMLSSEVAIVRYSNSKGSVCGMLLNINGERRELERVDFLQDAVFWMPDAKKIAGAEVIAAESAVAAIDELTGDAASIGLGLGLVGFVLEDVWLLAHREQALREQA